MNCQPFFHASVAVVKGENTHTWIRAENNWFCFGKALAKRFIGIVQSSVFLKFIDNLASDMKTPTHHQGNKQSPWTHLVACDLSQRRRVTKKPA